MNNTMAAGEKSQVERIFNFSVVDENKKRDLEISVKIPLDEDIKELVYRVLYNCKIPCYHYDDLYVRLKKFVETEGNDYYDKVAEKNLNVFKEGNLDVDFVVKYWNKLFESETTQYSEPMGTTDEELFSIAYHKLVHSPALELILQNEQNYACIAGAIAQKRIRQMIALSERQNEEMTTAVQELHETINEGQIRVSEKDINDLAAKHFEEQCLTSGRLNSEVDALHQSQKQEYRTWLMAMLEKQTICPSPLNSPMNTKIDNSVSSSNHEPWPLLEESFTIHLGSQMKQMHNVRILSANVLDFCKIQLQPEKTTHLDPQRIETALSLYSSNLSGIVLLSDVGSFDGFTGISKDFIDVCQETTEFHFLSIDNQLEYIKRQVKEAVNWRAEKTMFNLSYQVDKFKNFGNTKNLKAGDLFITKHSNLLQVHVVFHLLVDDSVKSGDMNSRHPVILGLRNVLKTAAAYDVTMVTLPLLLTNEMTEDMTVAWCSKRAELVFKCVKGFMIEAAGVGGAEINNLQFLVPSTISAEVFSTLATMLPSIFRVSNPLVIRNFNKFQKASE